MQQHVPPAAETRGSADSLFPLRLALTEGVPRNRLNGIPILRAAGGYSTVDISSPHGAVDWNLWSLRLDYTHSATLSASGYLQYNSSTATKILNLRMRWILPNDSHLYLVYNDTREDLLGAPALRTRELAVKMNYRLFI